MSRSNKSYHKREPKSKKDFRGCGCDPGNGSYCGMTCCGIAGKAARKVIRAHRRTANKEAIREQEK